MPETDVHNRAYRSVIFASRKQHRQKRARHQVNRAHVHVKQPVKIFRLRGFNRAHMANASVVYKDVEPVKL
jgi:hypothetical protein